ncbi:MAG: HEAT repeat domain-containing protein, partial [Anaerolineales bacterium]|nr:HEAT repeat domain-containing protein [Anaerolineales bacterium]
RLIGLLRNNDVNKRNAAARQLIQFGADAAPALAAALGSQEQALRTFVPQILVRIGADALPALSQAIRKDASPVPQRAAAILGQIGGIATPILLEALVSSDYKLQVAAAHALGQVGDKSALPKLLATLSDEDPDVRIAVAEAVAKFRAPQTYLHLADLLHDPEINVRQCAAQLLGEIGDVSTLPELVEALHDSFWWYGREEAINVLLEAIRKFGARAFKPLTQAMRAKEPTARRYAISLLAPLKDMRSLEPLQMAFYDPNYDVAEMAAHALTQFGPAAMPVFFEALSSPNDWIREQAVAGIASIGGSDAVNYLLAILDDSPPKLRAKIIDALGQLQDERALPALENLAAKRSNRETARLARQAIAAIRAA